MDMSNYKMIYKDQVFNVIAVIPTVEGKADAGFLKITFIEATAINENGELFIIFDEAFMFKFVRR